MSGPHLIWTNKETPRPSNKIASLSLVANRDVVQFSPGAVTIVSWMKYEFDRLTCQGAIAKGVSVTLRNIPPQDQLDQACLIMLSEGYCCSEPQKHDPKFPGDDPVITVWLERH
ncbi:MAG: hypothetical protein K2X77_32785 [Candidatus Obscuribacterales bacterium]|jgi:hypothetical protein|nr:hypothetical protein [Candidatus Obscuribacterales bacterium]